MDLLARREQHDARVEVRVVKRLLGGEAAHTWVRVWVWVWVWLGVGVGVGVGFGFGFGFGLGWGLGLELGFALLKVASTGPVSTVSASRYMMRSYWVICHRRSLVAMWPQRSAWLGFGFGSGRGFGFGLGFGFK